MRARSQRWRACAGSSHPPKIPLSVSLMSSHFPNFDRIQYEGANSKKPLSYKHYNPAEMVEGKSMRDHLRFSVVYWHTMCGQGADMFGGPTAIRPWEQGKTGLDLAKA